MVSEGFSAFILRVGEISNMSDISFTIQLSSSLPKCVPVIKLSCHCHFTSYPTHFQFIPIDLLAHNETYHFFPIDLLFYLFIASGGLNNGPWNWQSAKKNQSGHGPN